MAWNRSAPLTKRNQICTYAFLYREKVEQPHTFAHNLSTILSLKFIIYCMKEIEISFDRNKPHQLNIFLIQTVIV